jgi:hypothetical protein
MNLHRPYSHKAIEWINEDGERQCLRCERGLTGIGPHLRHVDEAVPTVEYTPEEAAAVRAAVDVVEQALADMWTDRCTDLDRAQVAVEALRLRGMVAVKYKRRRSSSAA